MCLFDQRLIIHTRITQGHFKVKRIRSSQKWMYFVYFKNVTIQKCEILSTGGFIISYEITFQYTPG